MVAAPAQPPASASSPGASGLSEAWEVQARHDGCYTGGKVVWSEAAQALGCLCDEELHLVALDDSEAHGRKVAHEGDGVYTFAVDPRGVNVCTSHRSGLLRHFALGDAGTAPVLVRAWRAHEQVVADVSFDATGSLVATGSVDRTAKVFDFTGYFCTHSFRGHPGIVSLVRFHPARLQLVTVSDAEARLWDLEASACVALLKDHLATLSSLCFGKVKGDTYQLVTGGRDQVVNVWSLEDKGKLQRSIPVFETVEGVATLPAKTLKQAASEPGMGKDPLVKWLKAEENVPAYIIVTVGDKAQIRLWSPVDGKCISVKESPHAAKGVLRQVVCVDQVAGRRLVTIGEDMNIIVWSMPDFRVVNYVMGHNEEILHVQLLPKLTWPKEGAEDSLEPAATSLKVSADRFVCIANDEHPRVVSCTGFVASLLRGHSDVVISCDVSADGRWIATGSKDQTIRVWGAEECRCACTLAGHAGTVSALSFPKRRPKGPNSGTGQPVMLVSASKDKTMKVWELPTPQHLEEALSGGKAGKELNVPKSKVTVVAHGKEVNDVVVAPNNKLIASGGQDKLVRVWSFPQAELLGECKGHRRGIWCVAFSPVDQVIASASADGTARLWNLKDYTAIRSFQGHVGGVLRVCFLQSGMQLMTSSADGLLKLWQIRTADCAATFEEHNGRVWCIDILGDRMVSGGADSKLCVWKDVTAEKAKERHDAQAEMALKDSKIGLLVQQGKVEEALTLALDLNRPGQMRHILVQHTMNLVGKQVARIGQRGGAGGAGGAASAEAAPGADAEAPAEEAAGDEEGPHLDLRRWVSSLNATQLERLVELLEQWNSNRRMASMAQMLMGLLLREVAPNKLMAVEGINATCNTILSYSTRHLSRVDALLQKTYMFDLVVQTSSLGLALQDDAAGATSALKRTLDVLHGADGYIADQDEAGDASMAPVVEEEDEEEAPAIAASKASKAAAAAEAAAEAEEEDGATAAKGRPRKKKRKGAA